MTRRAAMADATTDCPTTLGADAVFKGELTFEKGMRILGKFEGEINSGGQLTIADGASLIGNAKAGTISIDGRVKGNLSATTKVQLSSSARLEGDLETSRLEVTEGAVLIGRCVVGVNGDAKHAKGIKAANLSTSSIPVSKPKTIDQVPVGAKK
jgi:cytoskeletal protein CcmA (bactofilin family)